MHPEDISIPIKKLYFCIVKREQAIQAFSQLGIIMKALGNGESFPGNHVGVTADEYEKLQRVINQQHQFNAWFTKEAVKQSLLALGTWLETSKLQEWVATYNYATSPKKVAIIMAGNIPLVGFHDFLSVVLSGNVAVCKLSSDDKHLLPALVEVLFKLEPEMTEHVVISMGKIGEIDAVIATGSNNSMLYFEQYFGKYPHIFRKNRTSLAILDGSETAADFYALGSDIFNYFGLGCRNVSHMMVPKNYDFAPFFEGIFPHGEIINHFKYGNNYDYNKTVYLMNQVNLLDNNFVLLRETEDLHSPLAMLHYHTYENQSDIDSYISAHADALQVVTGKNHVPFGQAQCPQLTDYADGIDTMNWLQNLA